jgi:sortase A
VFLKWFGRALMGAGVTLLAAYGAARLHGESTRGREIRRFEETLAALRQAGSTRAGVDPSTLSLSPPDFSLWSDGRLRAYEESQGSAAPLPLALLRIPRLGLEVPVLDGTDEITLNRGVGRIPGTARPNEPGNIGIAGHRDGFFRCLKDIVPGDLVEIVALEGTGRYLVEGTTVVGPSDVEVLKPSSLPSLTLVTCYPFYFVGSAPQRYVVRAALEEPPASLAALTDRAGSRTPITETVKP